MSNPKKLRKIEDEPESDSSFDDSMDEDEQVDENGPHETAMYDFCAFAPDEAHKGQILNLLQKQLFSNQEVDCTELTNTILEQADMGTVLKYEEDEEDDDMEDDNDLIFGVFTIVNLSHKKKICMEQIRKYLVDYCKKNAGDQAQTLSEVLENPENRVGLIISERYLGIPFPVALPQFRSIDGELKRLGPNKQYTHFVLMSTITLDPKDSVKYFINAEEESFHPEEETAKFDFKLPNENVAKYRRVLVFPTKCWQGILDQLHALITDYSAQ